MAYQTLKSEQGAPIKAWVDGVSLEDAARKQLLNVSQLPFIFRWVAPMPDVHWPNRRQEIPPLVAQLPQIRETGSRSIGNSPP